MTTRALPRLLLVAALLNGCVAVNSDVDKTVSATTIDPRDLKQMIQTTTAGSLRVDSLIYKPAALPLGAFLKRLARGDFKKSLAAIHLRYHPANVDDQALKTILRRGFIPVLVGVTNTGDKPIDVKELRLILNDGSLALAPIPNDELPRAFESLDPKAVAANVYNTTAVVVGAVTFLAAIFAVAYAEQGSPQRSDHSIAPEQPLELPYALAYLGVSTDNDVFNPIQKTTSIDYNGLLFSPRTLAPGQLARGLLFFRAKGVDWQTLRLEASIP